MSLYHRILYLCILFSFIIFSNATYSNVSREKILNRLLNETSYDHRIPPNYENDHPTYVKIQLYITSIDSLSEASMDFSMSLFLRQVWIDPRLNFEDTKDIKLIELDQKMMENVWVPDTFFSNEKHASFHLVTVPNKLLHIYRNGTVFYSVRISMTVSCYMQLQTYPMDLQHCPVFLESYAYSTDHLIFVWKKPNAIETPEIRLPQFYMPSSPAAKVCHKNYGISGNFTCLQAEIVMKRNFGYYIVQIFIPSSLIVVLSWVSFWIDMDAVPARISLGILTVLTMTTQTSGIHASLPRVSYIKAIDVWMATCMVFVFGALLEFAYVNVLSRRCRVDLGRSPPIGHVFKEAPRVYGDNKKILRRARIADKIARFIFPLSFILFNAGFWVYFLYMNNSFS